MINMIVIHGYVGRNPEMTEHTNSAGTFSITKFSVGVSRDYGDETDWFKCVAYGRRAEIANKYLETGSEVTVTGRMVSYKPNTDEPRIIWSVQVSKLDFCGKKKDRTHTEETPAGFTEVTEEFDLF